MTTRSRGSVWVWGRKRLLSQVPLSWRVGLGKRPQLRAPRRHGSLWPLHSPWKVLLLCRGGQSSELRFWRCLQRPPRQHEHDK